MSNRTKQTLAKAQVAAEDLSRDDYDFTKLDRSELQVCCLYEYARESRSVRNEVELLRKQRTRGQASTDKCKAVKVHVNAPFNHQILMLLSQSEFPNTSWQHLPANEKKFLLRLPYQARALARYLCFSQKPALTLCAVQDSEPPPFEAWRAKRQGRLFSASDPDGVKCGYFMINLNYSETDLIEEFRLELRRLRSGTPYSVPLSPPEKPSAKPPGRRSFLDRLNALGAMRLRYHCCTFSEARTKLPEASPGTPIYAHRRDFNRACEAALKHFHNYLPHLSSERPIHWTNGWEK